MSSTEPQPKALPKGRLGENVVWLTSLQTLNYLLPMATVPYLIRVLGPNNYGVLSFAVTFSQYLVVLTDYGFNLSATRRIAIVRDDRRELEETISAVLLIKVMLLAISAVIMTCFVLMVPRYSSYWAVIAVAFLSVVGSVAFPVWLFQGLQDMRTITLLSSLGRIICTVAVFLTVHRNQDVLLATLWSVAGFPVAGLAAWFVIRRSYRLALHLPSVKAVREALDSGLHVFISSVMSNALINGAVLVMGFTVAMPIVGTYAAIEKIAKAAVMAFTPLTQALYPRTVEHFHKGYRDGLRFVMRSGAVVIGLALVAALALVAGAKPAIAVVCGRGYVQYYPVLQVLAGWLFLGVLNNILGVQYLLGSGRYRVYSSCFTISAGTTFLLLFLLLPKHPYMGAAVSITLGEALLSLLMTTIICMDIVGRTRLLPSESRGE